MSVDVNQTLISIKMDLIIDEIRQRKDALKKQQYFIYTWGFILKKAGRGIDQTTLDKFNELYSELNREYDDLMERIEHIKKLKGVELVEEFGRIDERIDQLLIKAQTPNDITEQIFRKELVMEFGNK